MDCQGRSILQTTTRLQVSSIRYTAKKMNQEESIAEQYLFGLELGQVVFEPDGNVPPDFSVGRTTGVEVRRLNQQYFGSSGTEGLEELSYPLWGLIKKELSKFDSKFAGSTYLIGVEYSRPYNESFKATKKSIRNELENFLLRGDPPPLDLCINSNLNFSVFGGKPIPGRTFVLAGGLDHNRGGSILQMYIDNINFCIDHKSNKIEPYLKMYKDWWLLLVDDMGWGMDLITDSAYVKSKINYLENFNRVVIIRNGDGKFLLDLDQNYAV